MEDFCTDLSNDVDDRSVDGDEDDSPHQQFM